MKRFILLFLLVVVCIPLAFSEPGLALGMTFDGDMKELERFSIEATERLVWHFGDSAKPVRFSLLGQGALGLAFATYDDEMHLHLDSSIALMPGASIALAKDAIFLNVFLGPKYSRVGYSGDVNTAGSWDKFLSIVTVGLAGSHPMRKLEVALDVSVQFAFITAGVTAALPIGGSQDMGYRQGIYLSAYGALDFDF